MSIPVKQLMSGIGKVVSDLVGTQLATQPTQSGTQPAIQLARQPAPKLPFPYAYIDFIGLQREGYSHRCRFVDDNENEITEFDYSAQFFVQIHGGRGNDPMTICEQFRSKLFTTVGRESMKEHLNGALLLTTSDITFNPSFMETDYEEVARVVLTLSVRSTITDEGVGIIEGIDLDGELYVDYDQTDPPLEVNVEINVP